MNRRWILPLCSTLLCAGSAVLMASHPTPEDTRREFEAVCARLTDDNVYYGDAIVRYLEAQKADPPADPYRAAEAHGHLGWELSRLGRHLEAIEELDQGLKKLDPAAGDRELELHRRMSTSLAVAHLQLGEDQNCVEGHTPRSCIVPFQPEAIHTRPEHTRKAGDQLLRHLQVHPGDLQARWLLNIARMVSGDYPDGVPPPLRLPPGSLTDDTGFVAWSDIAGALGVNTFDLSGGIAIEDFDGDGLLDLITSSSDPCVSLTAFRNDGVGGFEDVSSAWGVDAQLGALNLVHADFDNDGAPDILVLRGAWLGEEGKIRNSLMRNDLQGPTGRFVDVTAAAGLAYPSYPSQAAGWADYDNDGDLDLYVGNESTAMTTDPLEYLQIGGTNFRSQLFRNNGDGSFSDVARTAGVENMLFAKGVAWGDYDNDGDADLYVSNFGPNRLFRNNGNGTFTDVAEALAVQQPVDPSFATWFFDFDNDGDLDIYVSNYSNPHYLISISYMGGEVEEGQPILYRNDGGIFTDVSAEMGLTQPSLPMGANFGDLDSDGWLDFYLGTGVPQLDALMPNVMYHNVEGRRFEDVTFSGGFGHLQKGHGIAFGDLDNDGDQDLFHQVGGAFPSDGFANTLFENPTRDAHWLTLRLVGRQANRSAIGARIEVVVQTPAGRRSVHRQVGTGGSFGSSSLQQEIGLGDAEAIESVKLRWPGSGLEQVFTGVALDSFYRAVEGEAELVRLDLPRIEWRTQTTTTAHEHHHGDGS